VDAGVPPPKRLAASVRGALRDAGLNVAGFLLILGVTAFLGVLLRSGIETLLEWRWVWPAVVFAFGSGAAWATAFGLVRKEHLVNPEGRVLPLPAMAFVLGSAVVWVYIFAGLSYALMRLGAVHYDGARPPEAVLGALTDAYMWHFLDLVPGLKITEALGWKSPIDLQGGVRGILLVLFRAGVIYQVLAKATSLLRKGEPTAARSVTPGGRLSTID
jgi:hypothetical protein